MSPLMPEKRAKQELAKLKRLISTLKELDEQIPANQVERSCKPIAQAALKSAISTQLRYLLQWNVHVDDETLH